VRGRRLAGKGGGKGGAWRKPTATKTWVTKSPGRGRGKKHPGGGDAEIGNLILLGGLAHTEREGGTVFQHGEVHHLSEETDIQFLRARKEGGRKDHPLTHDSQARLPALRHRSARLGSRGGRKREKRTQTTRRMSVGGPSGDFHQRGKGVFCSKKKKKGFPPRILRGGAAGKE